MTKTISIIVVAVVVLIAGMTFDQFDKQRVQKHNACILEHPYNTALCQ
jgi:hypothetical protein